MEPEKEPVFLKIIITKDVYAKIEDFKKKWPGQQTTDVVVRVNINDNHANEQEFTMSEFLGALGLADADTDIKPCETCGGTGEVATDEDDGNGHSMRGVGTSKCPDCLTEPDNESDDE